MTITFPLPTELQGVGRVVGRFIVVTPDTANDVDVYPEARGATGSVTFTPSTKLSKTADYAAFVGHPAKTFPVDAYGIMQDEELTGGVWLREDVYTVSYNLSGLNIASHNIEVTSGHTEEDPLVLSAVGPAEPPTGSTLMMLQVPSGAVDGQLLSWSGTTGLVWAAGGAGGTVPNASTTVKGIVELATNQETITGTDPARVVTPAGVKAALDAKSVSDMSTYATKAELADAGGSVVADDTPAAPAEGTFATYFVTSSVSWPAGLEWSTDPDGDVAPTITGTGLVSMFTIDGTTRAVLGATFPALQAAPDVTNPTAGTLSVASQTHTTVNVSVSGATDETALHGTPYAFSSNGGSTYSAWQASASYQYTGLTASTSYNLRHKVRDASGNEAQGVVVAHSTSAAPADSTPPTVGTLAGSAITASGFTLTVSGASDETALHATPYRFSLDNGSTYSAWQSGATFNATGLDPETEYTCIHQVRDAADNVSTGMAIMVTTSASETIWASDTFTRADSATTLGVADTGQTWAYAGAVTPVWGVHSNSAYKVSPIYAHSVALITGLPSADMDVRATPVAYQGSAYFPGIVARATAPTTYYRLFATSTFILRVGRVTAGTPTDITADLTIGGGWLNKEIRLVTKEVGGATRVTAYCAGVEIFTTLDTEPTRPSGTGAGIYVYGNDFLTKLDNFSVRPA